MGFSNFNIGGVAKSLFLYPNYFPLEQVFFIYHRMKLLCISLTITIRRLAYVRAV
jgi:hypothetical protein